MSTELGKAYEVLGVKPGVSDRELKASHRDLAKVWHPDRFLHDPRLQEKAQEKLKEINEAYEQLTSRHKRRVRVDETPPARSQPFEPRVTVRRGVSWHWWMAAAMFVVVFAATVWILRPRHTEVAVELPPETPETVNSQPRPRNNTDSRPITKPIDEPTPTTAPVVPTPTLPTVTVSIDPATGLLATPTCPVKTRMTYPRGSEPRGYCNVSHIVKPEKDSAIKSLAKRVGIGKP